MDPLDQNFYEPNRGRIWMSFLEDPLHAKVRLPGGETAREKERAIAAAQEGLHEEELRDEDGEGDGEAKEEPPVDRAEGGGLALEELGHRVSFDLDFTRGEPCTTRGASSPRSRRRCPDGSSWSSPRPISAPGSAACSPSTRRGAFRFK